MIALLLLTANLAAIGVLSFAMFARRSHRIEIILVLLSVNILTFAATMLLTVTSFVTALELAAVLAIALAGALTLVHHYVTGIGRRDVAYAGAALMVGFASGLHTVAPVAQLAAVLVIVAATALLDWSFALAARYAPANPHTNEEPEPITMPLDFIPGPTPQPEATPVAPKPREKKPVMPVFIPPITAPEQVK